MRFTYLCADRGIPLAGNKGASVHVRAVAQTLAERGHDVSVVALRVDGDLPPGFKPAVVEVPFDRTLKDLRRSIDGGGSSVLSGEIQGLLMNATCHESLVEVEVEARGKLDGIYERYSLWSVAGLRFARSRGIPFVLEVDAPLVKEQFEYRDLDLREAAEGIERYLFSEADAIFVPSRELEAHITSRVGDRRRIYVTPNGFHMDLFAGPHVVEAPPADLAKDAFSVVFLGSLKPWHGVGVLLRAFEKLRSRIPRATLLVIGHGPMVAQVERLRDELGSDVVRVIGEVPHNDVPALLRTADVGVAPYPALDDFYFSPMKVIEYMAAGLPVVGSAIGQLCDLIEHRQTGLLVPPGDGPALADALVLLAQEPRKRIRMGQRAQRRVFRRHSWQRVAERIEEVFVQLSKKKSRTYDANRVVAPVRSGGGLN